jgi:diguanylate cyclase (GGDEF)-like protein/PAS domain S-box-containing protein
MPVSRPMRSSRPRQQSDYSNRAPAFFPNHAVGHEDVAKHLRATQSSLAETQAIAHLGSWDFDIATRQATWSDETYRIVGVDPETFIPSYEAFLGRIHPDDRAAFDKNYADSVANRGIHDIDVRIVMDDGTIGCIHTRGKTYYDNDGRPLRSVGTLLDITERRKAELALAESEKRYRDLVEAISELIWETDDNGVLTYLSPAAERVTGYRPEEVLGKSFSFLMRPSEATIVADRMRGAVANREPICGIESTVVRNDGNEIEVEVIITPVFNASRVVGYRGIIHDISERKKTEACLKKSEMQLANALGLTRAARWEFDVASNRFTFNDMFYAIYGTTAEDVGGYEMSPAEYAQRFVYPDDIPVVGGEMQIAIETSDPTYSRELEHRFVYANGETGVLAVKVRVLQDENGRTLKTYGVNQDITKRKRMEEELSLSKALGATAVECSPEGILIVAADMKVISFNHVFMEMWRAPKRVFEGPDNAPWLKYLSSQMKDPDAYLTRVHYLYANPTESAHDKLELSDGRVFDRDSVPLYDENKKYLGRAWFFRDITERMRAEQALRESEENFRAIFSTIREGIFVTEPESGKFVEVNPSACRMFGYSRDELIGADIGMISSGEPPYTLNDALKERHGDLTDETAQFDWHCRTRGGEHFWAAVSLQRGMFRGREQIFATLWDITERKKAEATILQMACYDPLTSLLNRRVFLETLSQAIARASRSDGYLAVLYLDLDHFKDINDILGHRVGDLLLREVSHRLQEHVREGDTVARFGGDEFAVIMSELADPEDAAVLSQKLLNVLSEPYRIQGNEIRSGTSIGIATYGSDSPDAESLITHADVALYRAKAEGRGTFQFFTDAMDQEVKARVSLAAELRSAISAEELELFYQPEVDLETGDILGLEALVRWNHPSGGLILPGEFVLAAERAGLIIELGLWVMREACRQARAWMDMQIAPAFVAINLSALQFKTPEQLERDIAGALAENRLPAQMLELELTETVLMQASRRNSETLLRLRHQGIRIAVDDFGTGYSSLDYLRCFHVDRIKIAQNFVSDLETVQGDRSIVRASLGLARELAIGVIAEGIETREQLVLLKSWGCREGQGYYFTRPLPAREVTELLRKRRGQYAASDAGNERAQGANSDSVRPRARGAGR